MKKFTHETLGTFTQCEHFDELRWESELELPAFAAFRFLSNGKPRRSKKVEVAIYSDELPPKSAFSLLSKIKRSQKALVKNICQTFFEDLHQQGYDEWPSEEDGYGMWWSRDPVAVALSCRKVLEKRLKQDRIWKPEDLFVVLYEPLIEIRPSDVNPGFDMLINMGAEFEEEHGVSISTDGRNVLDLGYSDDW